MPTKFVLTASAWRQNRKKPVPKMLPTAGAAPAIVVPTAPVGPVAVSVASIARAGAVTAGKFAITVFANHHPRLPPNAVPANVPAFANMPKIVLKTLKAIASARRRLRPVAVHPIIWPAIARPGSGVWGANARKSPMICLAVKIAVAVFVPAMPTV